MHIDVREAERSEAPVLDALMQMYLHDLSEFSGEQIGVDGRFAYPYLKQYWHDPERYPYLVLVGDTIERRTPRVAGFALVRYCAADTVEMAEFFVLRSFRRDGVGAAAARLLFERFPCRWRVAQESANLPAQAFWRRVIALHTDGDYIEQASRSAPVGIEQRFDLTR